MSNDAFINLIRLIEKLYGENDDHVTDNPPEGQPFIQTRSGVKMWPFKPTIDMIRLQDIAWGLSNQVRFGGHCPRYTVAQHAVLVSHHSLHAPLSGLHHDDSEAYLGDVPRPLKIMTEMAAYREAESLLQDTCYQAFGLSGGEPPEVKKADMAVFSAEVRDLMQPWTGTCSIPDPIAERIVVWSPDEAYYRFIQRHVQLTGQGHPAWLEFSWYQRLRWSIKDLFRGTRRGRTTT